MTTPKAWDWRTNPRTEAEWDWYCVHKAPQFAHCLWLAVHMPAKRVRRQHFSPAAGEGETE